MNCLYKIRQLGVFSLIAITLLAAALCPAKLVQAGERIESPNGLWLKDWGTTNRHQLMIVLRDTGKTRGGRNGTISFTLTPEKGSARSGKVQFSCAPEERYDKRVHLDMYNQSLAGQWARVDMTVEDTKGTSEFWFEVWLY